MYIHPHNPSETRSCIYLRINKTENCNFNGGKITLRNSDKVIDWSEPGMSARMLVDLFELPKKSECRYPERRSDIDVSVKGADYDTPNPLDFMLISVGEKGKISIDRSAVVRYLKACKVVYYHGRPYRYDGCTYTEINEREDIGRLIYQGIGAYPSAPFVTRTMVGDIIANLQATSTLYDIQPPDDWDIDGRYDTELIPFDNGLYSIENDELLPFTPYVFIRYRLATPYKPSLTEHSVESIYRSILPDDTTRQFFFEMVGFMLFSPILAPPAIFVMYGPGQTGKSALQSTVTKAAGEWNVSTLDITQISGTFTTAELQDKLINVCGETGSQRDRDYSKINGDLLKQLVNGDKITVQRKNKDPYEMRNTAKLWFLSNSLPDFGDLSSGMLRRVYVVPCRVIQSWEAQIYNKLQDYDALVWLVNRAMRGYIDFLNRGRRFVVSDEMRNEARAYRSQNGMIDYFEYRYGSSESEYIRMNLDKQSASEVYEEYRNYTVSSGGKALSKRKFNELIRNEYRMETYKVRAEQTDGKPTNALIFKKV